MLQMGRNVLDVHTGMLCHGCVLLMDRDTKYSSRFRSGLTRQGIVVIRLPPSSPNLNRYAERFVRSVKEECLARVVPIGQGMVRRALREYVVHYHTEHNHQGLENQLIDQKPSRTAGNARIVRRERLGGLLNYYEKCSV